MNKGTKIAKIFNRLFLKHTYRERCIEIIYLLYTDRKKCVNSYDEEF